MILGYLKDGINLILFMFVVAKQLKTAIIYSMKGWELGEDFPLKLVIKEKASVHICYPTACPALLKHKKQK